MKILCLVDINDYENRNSFPIDFIKALKSNKSVKKIDYGTKWLSQKVPQWDMVHIHWPENLLKGKILTKQLIEELDHKLKIWRNTTLIVCTLHNYSGHYDNSSLNKLLYKCVFNNCHGFIHMGVKSVELFNREFCNEFINVPYSIIPHGNYSSLWKPTNQSDARKKLGLNSFDKIILAIGKLRHEDEFNLMLKSFKLIANKNYKLLFSGTFRSPIAFLKDRNIKMLIKYVIAGVRWKYLLYTEKNVIARVGFQSDEALSDYLIACDIVFIPRLNILNSGNIPLGFTFGKVVVGPNCGNVGELLEMHHNPVFKTHDSLFNVKEKLIEGIALAATDLGNKNKFVADTEWNWNRISDLHIDFYNALIVDKLSKK